MAGLDEESDEDEDEDFDEGEPGFQEYQKGLRCWAGIGFLHVSQRKNERSAIVGWTDQSGDALIRLNPVTHESHMHFRRALPPAGWLQEIAVTPVYLLHLIDIQLVTG